MILETMSSGVSAKLTALFLGLAMVSEVVDIQSIPSVVTIGTAMIFAYRTVSKAKNERVAEHQRISETLRDELARQDEELKWERSEASRLREQLRELRATLATTDQDEE